MAGRQHLDEVEADVFVEAIEDEGGEAGVAPGSVDEEEALKEAELSDGVVGGTSGLKAFPP